MESPNELYDGARDAVGRLRSDYPILDNLNPRIMLVLGSGCGDVAGKVEKVVKVGYSNIKGMPSSTVKGHAGELIVGHYEGKEVIAFSGRNHYYEGNSAQEASYMVYLAHHLGAKVAIMTAAAGVAPNLNKRFADYPAKVGDVMQVKTYFPNFLPSSLRGPIDEEKVGARFNGALDVPSMSLGLIAQSVARMELNEPLKEGLYVPRQGPNYETPAEVSMLSSMAEVVAMPALGGMSTVPELEAANMLGMKSLVLAVVTNRMFDMSARRQVERKLYSQVSRDGFSALDDKGVSRYTLDELDNMIGNAIAANQPSHEEVAETAGSKQVTGKLEKIIAGVVRAVRL